MSETPAPSYSEQPTLAMNVAERCNAALSVIAQGEMMQNSKPFSAIQTGTGSVVIALVCSPRDCEIFAAILERIERGDYTPYNPQPGEGQDTLPL